MGKISEMPGYKEGAWWVQNFSASLPVLLLGKIENLKVIDCCAAPGGKTMQLASGGASTTSIDRSKRRVETLKQNLERTKLNSKIIISDILDFTPEISYDVVLLDAPCSSTGTSPPKDPEEPSLPAKGSFNGTSSSSCKSSAISFTPSLRSVE